LDADKPAVGWRRYIHSFVIIPALVALLFVVLAYVLTSTSREATVADYLKSIREGHSNVRWQAALELSRVLADPSRVPDDPDFIPTVLRLFTDAALHEDDPRVRLFLGLAMGRTGKPEFFDPLLQEMKAAEKVEDLSVYIRAIGFMQDERAVEDLMPLLKHADAVIRHETVQALGYIGAEQTRPALRDSLQDPEANVRWDAAIALAKMRDGAARGILAQLLDRQYYDGFSEVRPAGRTWAMETAIRTAVLLDDAELNVKIKQLSESDPNIKVRAVALEMVKQFDL
jgi:HEAT repeat protein